MIPFVYFGSSQFSVFILDELEKLGFLPTLIVSTPDKPQGRKLVMTPTPVTLWARTRKIPTFTPESLNSAAINHIKDIGADIFIVASYGKILPKELINLPKYKTINVHPSLLPKYRGPSPLQSMILADDKETGTSIMVIDEKMDHGPLLGQATLTIYDWPPLLELKRQMAILSVQVLAEVLPQWIAGTLTPKEQDHSKATYTKKITKEDGRIDLKEDPYYNFRKIQAYSGWPSAFFFTERHNKKIRVKITSARFEKDKLIIDKVIPEGKGEIPFRDL